MTYSLDKIKAERYTLCYILVNDTDLIPYQLDLGRN